MLLPVTGKSVLKAIPALLDLQSTAPWEFVG
jgi:hypothetical protein